MLKLKKITWVYLFSIIFILLNAYFLIKEQYTFTLIPVALLIVFISIFALDKLLYLIVFLAPISLPLFEFYPDLSYSFSIPTEPLLFGILIIFILKLLISQSFDKKILLHPVSILIYINLFWMLLTSATSTMPVVSFKYFVARLWFLASFYFLATQLFKNKNNIHRYFWFYIIPLIIVIGYTINRHLAYGLFDQEAANFVCNPFFADHTSYGAVLAMLLPLIIGTLFIKNLSLLKKIVIWIVLIIYITALVLSFTRAAWVSLVAAFIVFLIMIFKIKFRLVFVLFTAFTTLFFVYRTDIIIYLQSNHQDSSTNIEKHIESISNISSDASNMERLNRWSSAYRMFKEKPFLGWGPGTYMFKYAPFQLSYEKTIISTNAGDKGNAHSEYFGPLAESGVLGMLTVLALVVFIMYLGVRNYTRAKNREIKILSLVITLGFFTYLIHGIMNDFLDMDKASALFWGYAAVLVAIDVYHLKNDEENKINENSKSLE